MADGVNDSLQNLSRAGLTELLRAREHASCVNIDPWQFAVEITELQCRGLSNSDLRRLMLEGFLEHGQEKAVMRGARREFSQTDSICLTDDSCFVLTETGYLFAAQACNGPSCPTARPSWDWASRELKFHDFLIKRFRCPAQNQEAVLAAFEEEQWPSHIDDPLPQISGQCPKQRLHDTIKSLNRHHHRPIIRFRGDGTGEGVIWEFCSCDGINVPQLD